MKRKFADMIAKIELPNTLLCERHCGFLLEMNQSVTTANMKHYIELIMNQEDRISLILSIKNCIFINCHKQVHFYTLKFQIQEIAHIFPIKAIFFQVIDKKYCDYYQYREIVIAQITPLPNHIVVLHSGRYENKPVVDHVLGGIMRNMKKSSIQRQVDFDVVIVKQKLLEAFERLDSNFQCKCGRMACREILQLYGDNGISPDKKFDHLSYIDENQIIDFVVKPHNCAIKPNQPPKERKTNPKWICKTSSNMSQAIRWRVQILEKHKKISEIDKKQISRFKSDTLLTFNHYKELLCQKRVIQNDLCKTCKIPMYFGDENGVLKFSYPNQASPDRIDNENIFYDFDNFNLVCVSCNFSGNQNTRRFIKNEYKNEPVNFTPDLLEACKEWLKF
jgi:hypothetical protein